MKVARELTSKPVNSYFKNTRTTSGRVPDNIVLCGKQ